MSSTPSASPTTPDLVALRRGETLAWRAAFVHLWPRAHRVAFRVLADSHLAEDVAAEVLQDLARQTGRLRSWPELEALTLVTARRRAISRQRERLAAKRGGGQVIALDADLAEIADLATTARDALDLADLLQKLDPLRRQIIEAHYLEGETSQEIGARLGLNPATVRSHLLRALQHLRRDLPEISRETAS